MWLGACLDACLGACVRACMGVLVGVRLRGESSKRNGKLKKREPVFGGVTAFFIFTKTLMK